ncbi:MAG: hypothetical protein AAF541_18545 [Pseudomonadota bacterium]
MNKTANRIITFAGVGAVIGLLLVVLGLVPVPAGSAGGFGALAGVVAALLLGRK